MNHPVYQGSSTNDNGSEIILRYDQSLSTEVAAADDFIVTVDRKGREIHNSVTNVEARRSDVALTLKAPISSGEDVYIEYDDPSPSNDERAIQSHDTGEDAYSITRELVTNNSIEIYNEERIEDDLPGSEPGGEIGNDLPGSEPGGEIGKEPVDEPSGNELYDPPVVTEAATNSEGTRLQVIFNQELSNDIPTNPNVF